MAIIFKPDESFSEVEPKNGTDFTLDELQKIVGGYIEVVYLPSKMMLIVDEEGKIKGKPINQAATFLLEMIKSKDCIAGDALYCKQKQVK